MSRKVIDAELVNGKPVCGHCKSSLGNKESSKFITDIETGENYNLFQRYCSKCEYVSRYYVDTGLNGYLMIPFERVRIGNVTTDKGDD